MLACDNTGVENAPTSPTDAAPETLVPQVTVRYWAAARTAAGHADEVVSGASVADVLTAVRLAHAGNPRLLQVLGVSSLLLGDTPLGTRDLASVPVDPGDVLEVLPPFAGG